MAVLLAALVSGTASAQWLDDEGPPFGWRAPRLPPPRFPPPPVSPPGLGEGPVAPQRVMAWVARQGYREVTRPRLVGNVYLVDGIAADGSRVRFVVDAFNGEVIDSRPIRVPAGPHRFEDRLDGVDLGPHPAERPSLDRREALRSDPLPSRPARPLPSARPAPPKPPAAEAKPPVESRPPQEAKPPQESKPRSKPDRPAAADGTASPEPKPAAPVPPAITQAEPAPSPPAAAGAPAAPAPAVEAKPQPPADAKPETTARAPGPQGPVRVIEGVTPIIPKDGGADSGK